ncbi:hypothetical protein H4R34_001535 [Dimargaris verticillata]|uniref:Corrinoid adenosyltransferase MMAB n=1 Tax=Dimargaris verticillata TaxID=2761393 RepID=A0A9W8B8A2_9FUNG|nr:hypothetical protein H4R34_001535 [Dimargaris verticillata]
MADLPPSGSVPKSKLYTRTGDKGKSSLYSGARAPKSSLVFSVLGDIDELNSSIGIAHHYCRATQNGLHEQLEEVQCRLLEIGSSIATPPDSSSEAKTAATRFDGAWVAKLEQAIDVLDHDQWAEQPYDIVPIYQALPPLKNFILPSGGQSAVFLHQCRSICRRAERSLVHLAEQSHGEPAILQYVNRLGDYLFAAARFAAQHDQLPETIFKSGQPVPQNPL